MRPLAVARIALFAALIASPPTLAQPAASGRIVDEIEIIGAESTTRTYIFSLIQLSVGQPADQAAIEADVRRLLETGRFLSAEGTIEVREGRTVVVFTLTEAPRITSIRFVGNVKIRDKKLTEQVPIQVGDAVDLFRVREGRDNIVSEYRKKGYGNVVVDFDSELARDTGELVYTIEEGPQVRVVEIRFEGNTSIAEEELLKQIKTTTKLWFFRDGNFDVDQVEQDAAAVQNHYRDSGFLDARASYRVETGEKTEDIVLVFVVAEGTRYTIESVTIEGNTVFTGEELAEKMLTKEGTFIRLPSLETDVRTIQNLYGDIGYIYAEARAERVFAETPGFVLVSFYIVEGESFRVGRVIPRGNETTKDKVIRREIDLYPPDDVINLSKMRAAEQRLRETQIFSFASITPVGEEPGVRDLVVNVEESSRAGDFIFGVGVNSNNGLIGNFVLDVKNFDLFDWPRSFAEFIKARAFRGAGQRLRIELQPGTELTRMRVDFVEPYFLDKPIRFNSSVYYFERGRDSYDEERVGGLVGFGKRLPSGFLKDWYVDGTLRGEAIDIDSLDLFAPRDVRDVEGSNILTSVKGSLIRDRTDSRWVPSAGDVINLSWEQFGALGGDHFFSKLRAAYTRHWTLLTDVEGRRHILSVHGDVGAILGESPMFERFYAGGIGSIRGFEFRGITPRQGLKDDAVGGDFLAMLRTEYSFPLVGDNLRGLVFTDMGTVERDFEIGTWRASVGFGMRLHLEFFGPVPMEFDFAFPIAKDGDDEEQIFSFFIGQLF